MKLTKLIAAAAIVVLSTPVVSVQAATVCLPASSGYEHWFHVWRCGKQPSCRSPRIEIDTRERGKICGTADITPQYRWTNRHPGTGKQYIATVTK